MPHLNLVAELEKRKGTPLTTLEHRHLDRRVQAAKYWLENYATEEEKTKLQETLPARAAELSEPQRVFLRKLAEVLPSTPWQDEALQAKLFEVAKTMPMDVPQAFKAIYCVLLDRDAGPKAGNLLAFLKPEFVVKRFGEVP
jgi:lysyl-tRNA synthetase class 1